LSTTRISIGLKDYAAAQNAPVVAICAKIEAEMADMSDEDRLLFLEEMGLHEPGLNRLIRAAYDLLGLQTYFTAGVKEVRAWTVHKGDTGPQAAGVIHIPILSVATSVPKPLPTTTSLPSRVSRVPKMPARCAAEGKEYIVKDGDVMNFLFSS
jgi:ribosome-binding ATPase YchF (GTP1/OBG family)